MRNKAALGQIVMWCSALIAAVTLVLYLGAKRDHDDQFQIVEVGAFNGTPYFITLGICAVAFLSGVILYSGADDR